MHTKGPWLWDIMPCELRADDDKGTVLLRCSINHEPNKANARLIAAAPDMLEALEEIANYENDFNPHMTGGDAHTMRVAARKAIRKAKGE